MDSLSGFSFNCRGLSDPVRAVAIRNWKYMLNKKMDFACLQEVKCTNNVLNFNLKRIDNCFQWFCTSHEEGRGGAAIGISPTLAKSLKDYFCTPHWVKIALGAPYMCNIICVYAPNLAIARSKVWEEISQVNNPTILLGDLNMVETLADRHNLVGHVVAGEERRAWANLCNQLELKDMSINTGPTWSNHQIGNDFRAARLDRCYMSVPLLDKYSQITCFLDKTTHISDHFPIILDAKVTNVRCRNGWFHSDSTLFKCNVVQKSVQAIFTEAFKLNQSPSKAWAIAVRNTQTALIQFKKDADAFRSSKKQKIIELLASFAHLDPSSHAVLVLKEKLKKEELIEAQRARVFYREIWAGKADRPCKETFINLKKKKAKEFIPALRDKDGRCFATQEEKLMYSGKFFADIFSSPPKSGPECVNARARIASIRPKAIPAGIRQRLDAPISLQELADSIDKLGCNKSPGIDGLPNEFYKEFSPWLCPLLLQVWEESLRFGALQRTINMGVIKLIHKRGERDVLDNWRPITCLNSAYKVIALVMARRLSCILDNYILKEPKGFIKGRYILDAIITLWESFDFAIEENLDFLFFKIDFDKAYDRVEWAFVLQSLADFGCGRQFCRFVNTLFGNASARVAINGELSGTITLMRSIR